MAECKMLVCDVTSRTKDVVQYQIELTRKASQDEKTVHKGQEQWLPVDSWRVDLSPGALQRLMKFLEKGCHPPQWQAGDDGEEETKPEPVKKKV